MVKAGKQTLTLAARYSPIAASNPRRQEYRRSVSYQNEVCKMTEPSETSTALKTIRTEFCRKYKSRLENASEQQQNEEVNAESQELTNLYQKLREVVPSLSQARKSPVTSLDVVLSAIDYIRDLHTMLGEKFPPPPGLSSVQPSWSDTKTIARTPLARLDNNNRNFYSEALSDDSTQGEDSPRH